MIIWAFAGLFASLLFVAFQPLVASQNPALLTRVPIVENFEIYYQQSLVCARKQPAFIGTLPESCMTFPVGYLKSGPWQSVVSASGVMTTWYQAGIAGPSGPVLSYPPALLAPVLARISQGALNGGLAQGGVVTVVGRGPALSMPAKIPFSLPVPPGIPDGALVIVSNVP
jgi:hypothetical protein